MRVHQTQQSITSTPKRNTSAHSILTTKKKRKGITFEHAETKKKRRKPGTVALKEIKYYQSRTELLLAKSPFSRLIKEIGDSLINIDQSEYKWQSTAIEVLQNATEAYLVALFEDVNKAAIHAKRVTVRAEDLRIVRTLRSRVNANEIF